MTGGTATNTYTSGTTKFLSIPLTGTLTTGKLYAVDMTFNIRGITDAKMNFDVSLSDVVGVLGSTGPFAGTNLMAATSSIQGAGTNHVSGAMNTLITYDKTTTSAGFAIVSLLPGVTNTALPARTDAVAVCQQLN
jgi:hypothetical protein